MTRQLIADDGVIARYRVLDGQGKQVGFDEEPSPANTTAANEATVSGKAQTALAACAAIVADNTVPAWGRTLARAVGVLLRLQLRQFDSTQGT